MSTNIVNSFVVDLISTWWAGDFPSGIDYACIGSESSKTFYPFDSQNGLDLDWLTYTVLPVEGSSMSRDTLPAYYLNFAYSGTAPPPCNTIVDTEEPLAYQPERAYPNPATDYLQFRESSPGATFTAFTTDGRMAVTKQLDAAGRADVSDLASGLYFYSISAAGQRGRSGRFVRR